MLNSLICKPVFTKGQQLWPFLGWHPQRYPLFKPQPHFTIGGLIFEVDHYWELKCKLIGDNSSLGRPQFKLLSGVYLAVLHTAALSLHVAIRCVVVFLALRLLFQVVIC